MPSETFLNNKNINLIINIMGGGGSIGPSYDSYSKRVTNARSQDQDDCDSLFTEILLSNLQPVFIKYKVGDVLEIAIDNGGIIAVGGHGICGYVTSLDSKRLIDCINKGKTFKAVIIRIDEASCKVRITIKL